MTETRDEREAEAKADGRTYWTARCNCYRDHESASGRCRYGQGPGLWTLPERKGVCDSCWGYCRSGLVRDAD